MVIGRGTKDGEEFLLLGLSRENIARLTGGEPVHLRRVTHGDGVPDGWEIVIMFGETEDDIHQHLKALQAVSEDTNIIRDKRL